MIKSTSLNHLQELSNPGPANKVLCGSDIPPVVKTSSSKVLFNLHKPVGDIFFGVISAVMLGVSVKKFLETKKEDTFRKCMTGSKVVSSSLYLSQGLISLGRVIFKCIVTAQKYLSSLFVLKGLSFFGSVFSGVGSAIDLICQSVGMAKNKDKIESALINAKLLNQADVVKKITIYKAIKSLEIVFSCLSVALSVIFSIQLIGVTVFPPIAIVSLVIGSVAVLISGVALNIIFKTKEIEKNLLNIVD